MQLRLIGPYLWHLNSIVLARGYENGGEDQKNATENHPGFPTYEDKAIPNLRAKKTDIG